MKNIMKCAEECNRDHSGVRKTGRAFLYVLWTIGLFSYVKNELLICIQLWGTGAHLTYKQSVAVLIGIMAAGAIIGFIKIWVGKRTFTSTIWTILAPAGVFLLLELSSIYPLIISVFAVLLIVCMAAYCVYVTNLSPPDGQAVPKKRFRWTASGSGYLVSRFLSLVAIIGISLSLSGMWNPREIKFYSDSEHICEPSLDKVAVEVLSNWETAEIQDKMIALQSIVDNEAVFLGLDRTLLVNSKELASSTLGTYTHKNGVIAINTAHLRDDKAIECVSTILHECFHAFQYSYSEAYSFVDERYKRLLGVRLAGEYATEIDNYCDGKSDTEAYYEQSIERDARLYEQSRIAVYAGCFQRNSE